jgi:hypothetical protein
MDLIIDMRFTHQISKKSIISVDTVYVVQIKWFVDNYVHYKLGQNNIFQIKNYYKFGTNDLSNIPEKLFPYSTYHSIFESSTRKGMIVK